VTRGTARILVGDCLEVMAGLEPASFSAIVTDPPYEIGILGKEWDSSGVAFDPATWRAAARLLKPGGHLIAFGAPRTFHRLFVALEDAGLELRDCLAWFYANGFPKSLDVSKAIDRQRTDDVRPVCRFLRAAIDRSTHTTETIGKAFGFNRRMVEHWAARDTDSQPTVPTLEQWARLVELLELPPDMDAEVARLNGRKGTPGENWARREVIGQGTGGIAPVPGCERHTVGGSQRTFDITAPASLEARTWEGYGTGLKPAWEPIALACKPPAGTWAENALEHGVAGLALAGSSILPADCAGMTPDEILDEARCPANLVLDEGAAAMLPPGTPRFCFTSKAATRERNARGEVHNDHPTVKPLDLMGWLVGLVTMPAGTRILDPFAGSGSTLIAALRQGVEVVGIERSADYAEIARARIVADAPLFNRCEVLEAPAPGS